MFKQIPHIEIKKTTKNRRKEYQLRVSVGNSLLKKSMVTIFLLMFFFQPSVDFNHIL